jgi:hypothetical protein
MKTPATVKKIEAKVIVLATSKCNSRVIPLLEGNFKVTENLKNEKISARFEL